MNLHTKSMSFNFAESPFDSLSIFKTSFNPRMIVSLFLTIPKFLIIEERSCHIYFLALILFFVFSLNIFIKPELILILLSISFLFISFATILAKTSDSNNELDARRLAPCIPVAATSPQHHRPSTDVCPLRLVFTPPM